MNSEEYKKICGSPDVLSKKILQESLAFLVKGNMPEAAVVEDALRNGKIDFPEKYSGTSDMSYHKVSCSFEEASRIADFLFEKEADSVPVSGIATSETYNLVELVNVWHELTEFK